MAASLTTYKPMSTERLKLFGKMVDALIRKQIQYLDENNITQYTKNDNAIFEYFNKDYFTKLINYTNSELRKSYLRKVIQLGIENILLFKEYALKGFIVVFIGDFSEPFIKYGDSFINFFNVKTVDEIVEKMKITNIEVRSDNETGTGNNYNRNYFNSLLGYDIHAEISPQLDEIIRLIAEKIYVQNNYINRHKLLRWRSAFVANPDDEEYMDMLERRTRTTKMKTGGTKKRKTTRRRKRKSRVLKSKKNIKRNHRYKLHNKRKRTQKQKK